MIQDLKFALRQLFKAPGFTLAAVIVLALGIGANTAVFSLVHTMFFAPPPYAKPQEVVQVFSQDNKDPGTYRRFSLPTYIDIRAQNTFFADVMSYNLAMIGIGQKGDTRRTFGGIVSSNYFSVLGVPLARGRTFLPEEETLGRNAPVAIVSYAYWQKHNLDPAVLGSELLVNGHPFTVVGTAPSGEGGLEAIAPMLLGMAIVVLLVACLNLANMLLARGTARRKEIAIRLALGGSRFRIVRQLLTEGFVLAILGGACGLVLGLWSSDLLVASLGKMLPLDIVWLAGPNFSILAATFAFCVVGTLGFALGPALKLSRSAVVADLKEQAGEDVVRRRWRFLPRNPLVVAQIAFSLALLTAAALFIRGANKAAKFETGLHAQNNLLLEVDAGLSGTPQAQVQQTYRRLSDR